MKDINEIFFELIQVSLGMRICLSHTPSADEWGELYAMAKKQSLVGVCFAGVQKLQAQRQELPEMTYLTWMWMAAKIQQRNEVVNRQCVELQAKLAADGFRNCILKGQTAASLYEVSGFNEFQVSSDLSLLRQSGDIDIWVEGGFEKVNVYVQAKAPTRKIDVQHIEYNVFSETEVEAHYVPFVLPDPIKNKVLKRFFDELAERQFTHKVTLPNGGEVCAASTEFNLVFQLVHIFHHLFTEGVGMRQLMDYFFVLKHEKEVQEVSVVSKVQEVVFNLGLAKFASALMWALGHVFGLLEEQMLWKPNEADGRFLLDEIMKSGNFGKQDERQKGLYDSKWNSFWMVYFKTFRFWRFDYWAWFWSPVMRVKWFVWKKANGYV